MIAPGTVWGQSVHHRFLCVISPVVPLSNILPRKEMLVSSSNDHVLINSKTIPFDSALHDRDCLFLSYRCCPSLLSQFLYQDWDDKTESIDILQAIVSSNFFFFFFLYPAKFNSDLQRISSKATTVIETYKSSHFSHFFLQGAAPPLSLFYFHALLHSTPTCICS